MYPGYYSVFHYLNALDRDKKAPVILPPKPKFCGISAPIDIKPPKKPSTS
jgi:hypothetical protein